MPQKETLTLAALRYATPVASSSRLALPVHSTAPSFYPPAAGEELDVYFKRIKAVRTTADVVHAPVSPRTCYAEIMG